MLQQSDIFPKSARSQHSNFIREKTKSKRGFTIMGGAGGNLLCKEGRKVGFKQIDIYGQEINLTYRGDQNFKTTPGAITTVFVFFVLLAYATYRSVILFNKINPDISKKGLIRNLNEAGPFKP